MSNRRWLFIFVPFLALVVGLLVWLHAFSSPQMEHEGLELQYEGVLIADRAPSWFERDLELMDSHLPEGFKFPRRDGKIVVEHGTPEQNCSGKLQGESYGYPCRDGWVTVLLWDEKIAACADDDCEVGVAFWHTYGPKCSIMIPPRVEDSLPASLLVSDDPPTLPENIEAMVGAHEYVHCLRGKGHAFTRLFGPFYSYPTGHLMHPSVLGMGWETQGLGHED